MSSYSTSIRTSFLTLFVRDEQREARLSALSDLLEHGSEEQYLKLLIDWGVPVDALHELLNHFRKQRREKRRLRQ